MKKISFLITWLILMAAAASCGLPVTPGPVPLNLPEPSPTQQNTQRPTITPSPIPSPTFPPTETSSPSPSATNTSTPTETPTPSLTPTYAILRARVMERSNCRYGPGAPYLYKYGLVVGSNLEVIGRTDSGAWILVQAIGGNNPCWVKASLMEVKGDVMTVAPTYLALPQSPYYGPLSGAAAVRNGDEVTISWNGFQLRAGDETASPPYLVEAWICQGGDLVFIPTGSYQTAITLTDQAGCEEASHARVFGVEKHGYTRWVEVPWPPQD